MRKEYYVILNLETLEYQANGEGTDISHADKFNTLEEVRQELKTYDNDCYEFAIYKATEYVDIDLNRVKEDKQ